MLAFVLSGGGSRGALQVGALQALIERGLKPDIVVGCSVGGINGFMAAYEPSATNLARLADIWRNLSRDSIYPGNYASVLWRLARGNAGLFSNDNFKAFLARHVPDGLQTFGDLTASAKVMLYIIATQLPGGDLHVFGEAPGDNLLDALVASSALPPFHPPYQIDDQIYVDGGVVANLPLKVALARGAKTIYALHVVEDPADRAPGNSALSVAHWSIARLLHDQSAAEIAWVRQQRGVNLHHLQLSASTPLANTDFSQSSYLITRGYKLTTDYLNSLPLPPVTRLGRRARGWAQHLSALSQHAREVIQRAGSPGAEQEI